MLENISQAKVLNVPEAESNFYNKKDRKFEIGIGGRWVIKVQIRRSCMNIIERIFLAHRDFSDKDTNVRKQKVKTVNKSQI